MIIIENVFKYGSPIYAEVVYGTTSAGGGSGVWGSITGTITNQTDLVAYVNNRVPYTGATSDVNLGEFGLLTGNIEFDNTPTNVPTAAGSLYWDSNVGVINSILLGGNVNAKLGVDNYVRVVNKVGSNLTKANYRALKITTPQGQRLAVNLAQGNNDANSAETIGINAEDIGNNQEGFIITFGEITNINTTGSQFGETWADGDVLYLSPTTAGYLTKVKPLGQHIVVLGYVEYAHANNGKIFVKVMNGWELEELHDVVLSSPTNGQVLTYNLATDKWINAAIPTVNTLYSADGTLSGSRIVTIPTASSLTFRQDSLDVIRFGTTGSTFIGNTTSPKTVYIYNTLRVYGTAFITDEATGDGVLKIGANRTSSGNSYIDLIGDTTYTVAGLRIRRYDTGANANSRIEHRGTGSLQLVAIDAGNVELWTNGSSRVFVDPSGSVGINQISPNTSSILDIVSTTRGILIPRMTGTQRDAISTPANSLLIFNTSSGFFNFYNGTSWAGLATTSVFTSTTTGLVPASGGGTSNFLRADGSWVAVSGTLSDGNKGDITVSGSGATWTINAQAVVYADIQNVAANSFLANVTGSSATVQEIATNRIPLFASAITGTPSASTFLRGDGSWATVSGSGITSLNGLTATTQTFANDTNVTITSATSTHTLGWSGQLSIARGGTGASTATAAFDALNPMTTLGDMIYEGTGPTAVRLAGNTTTTKNFLTQTGTGTVSAAPAWGTILGADVPNFTDTLSGAVPASGGGTTNFLRADGTWAAPSGGGGGITTLNTLTDATQTFATGTSGTDFNISSATSTHTFNIPNASNTAGSRGLIIQGAQTIGGNKIIQGSGTTSGTSALIVRNSSSVTVLQVRDDTTVFINTNLQNLTGDMTFNSSGFVFSRTTTLGNNTSLLRSATGVSASSGANDINYFLLNGTLNSTSTSTSVIRDIFLNHTFTSVTGSYRGIDIVAPSSPTGGGTITYLQCRTSTADVFLVQPTTITIGDAVNFALNTTTGTKFGTATNQRIGFYNATPIVQPTTATAAGAFVANTGTAVNDASTFAGYTIGSAIAALRNLGLLA